MNEFSEYENSAPSEGLAGDREPDAAGDLDRRLAARLAALRRARGWSLDALATRSGVSRATLSRIEAAKASPTAQTLARLCAAHGEPMSRLLRAVEREAPAHVPKAAQPVWRDPAGAFIRRSVSPRSEGFAAELVEATLAPGATIAYPAAARAPTDPPSERDVDGGATADPFWGAEHHLWLLDGGLTLSVGRRRWSLEPGDCVRYRLDGDSLFEASSGDGARYVLAIL